MDFIHQFQNARVGVDYKLTDEDRLDWTSGAEMRSETFNDSSIQSFVSERFKFFYLEGRFTDISLKADTVIIRAHKIVLAAASAFFEAQFSYEGVFDRTEMVLPFDGHLLKDLVDYIYFGKITINQSNIVGLMELQDYFQIASLRNLIHYYIKIQKRESLLLIGALKLKPEAELYRYHDLATTLFLEMKLNFSAIARQKEFLDISFEYLLECLSSDVLKLKTEDELLLVLCQWVAIDADRHEKLDLLLGYIEPSAIKQWNKSIERALAIFINSPELTYSLNRWFSENDATRLNQSLPNVRSRYKSIVKPVLLSLGGVTSFDDPRPVQTVDCIGSWSSEKWRPMIPTVNHHDLNLRSSVPMPLMITPRLRPLAACNGTHVFVAGGGSHVVDMYDSVSNSWSSLPSLPGDLKIDQTCSMTVLDGALYIIVPGIKVSNSNTKPARFMILHKDSKSWQDLTPPLLCTSSFLLSSLSSLYLFINDDLNNETLVRRYDPSLDVWIVIGIPSLVNTTARFVCSCVSYGHLIYVTYNNMALYSYDTITYQWTRIDQGDQNNELGTFSRGLFCSTKFGYQIVLAEDFCTEYLFLLSISGLRTKWLSNRRFRSGLAYFNLGLYEAPDI